MRRKWSEQVAPKTPHRRTKMTATRLLRNKWVLVLGVLTVLGMVAGQSLADPPHHGGYASSPSYGSGGGYRHWTPSFGHYRPFGGYHTYGGGYYSTPVVVRPPCTPYYGGYSTYVCTPVVRVIIVVR
jgi:uncharacterized membrane protein